MGKKGYIYIVQEVDGNDNEFKIGMTTETKPEKRVKQLDGTGNARALSLAYEISTHDAKKVEKQVHANLTGDGMHMRKEWFNVRFEVARTTIEHFVRKATPPPPALSGERLLAFKKGEAIQAAKDRETNTTKSYAAKKYLAYKNGESTIEERVAEKIEAHEKHMEEVFNKRVDKIVKQAAPKKVKRVVEIVKLPAPKKVKRVVETKQYEKPNMKETIPALLVLFSLIGAGLVSAL